MMRACASSLSSTALLASSVAIVPGRDRVDADAVVGERQRHHPRQLVDRALARVVAGDASGSAVTPLTELMLTIAPPPPSAIARATAWPTRNAPFRLTSMTASQSASAMSRKSAALKDAGVVDEGVDPAEGGERRGERGVDIGACAPRRSGSRCALRRARELARPRRPRRRRRPRARPRRRRRESRAHAAPMPCAPPVTTTRGR